MCETTAMRCAAFQALADLFYSFAVLGCEAQHMTDVILESLVYDLKQMSPACLSQLVYGLHLLNHRCLLFPGYLLSLGFRASVDQFQVISQYELEIPHHPPEEQQI